jgi:4-amino-4-deoxy-L-arabinose transferase-like glycosyltransferase
MPYLTDRERRLYRLLTPALLLLAAWLFWRQPLAVPPGLEMDELIEGQIAEQILAGRWHIFHEEGQGREGLYYYWLALWLQLVGTNVFSLRMASTTVTLLGLSGLTALLRRLFGGPVALLALAYAATSFWLIFAARSGLRSTSLLPLAALAAIYFWDGLRKRRWYSWLLAGFFVGLSFLAYTAGRVLPIIFLLFLLYLFIHHRSWLKGQMAHIGLMGGVMLVTALPLLLYLQANPEADQFDFMEFERPLVALRSGDIGPAMQTSLQTVGMFTYRGDPLIFDNVPDRPIFSFANGLLFVAGILLALWHSRCRPPYAFVLIWLLVGLLPGMLSQPAPNFYRTALAQLVTFLFPALTLWTVFGTWYSDTSNRTSKAYGLSLVGYCVLFTVLLGSQLASNWRAYFQEWPQVKGVSFFWQTRLTAAADFLTHATTDQPVVLCTSLTDEYDDWWRPAWQSMRYLLPGELPISYYDCRSTFVLPNVQPFLNIYLDDIPPGEWWMLLPLVQPVAELETAWQVEATVPPAMPAALPATLAPEVGGAEVTLPVQFGDSLQLLGYQYGVWQDGRFPAVITVWEVILPPPPRLALFTHLMLDPQTIIAQQDGLPLTSHSLQPGDRFWVRHDQISRPPDLPDAEVFVAIGLYSQDTYARLPLRDGGDRLFLESLQLD